MRDNATIDRPPAGDHLAPVIEVHTSAEELSALEGRWNRLIAASARPSPFLTWEWLWTWCECFPREVRPWVVTARDPGDGELLGLVPFAVRALSRGFPLRYTELTFMGSRPPYPDHLDAPIVPGREAALAGALVEQLRNFPGGSDVLRLDGMAENSRLLAALLSGTRPRWRLALEMPCPFIELPASWEEYHAGLDQKLRYNLRSRAKRLRRDAEEETGFHTVSDESELDDAMASLFRLHDAVRARQGEPSSFTGANLQEFHRRTARAFLERGWLRLHQLRVGKETIAVAYCFHYGEVTYFYQTGYDPSWSRYGPGAAILAHAIEQAIGEGAREFDFLRGDEGYKAKWASDSRTILSGDLGLTHKGKLLIRALRLKRRLDGRHPAVADGDRSGRGGSPAG